MKKVILVIESSREYGRGLLRGIARYSNMKGPWTFYNEPGDQYRAIPNLKNFKADGIITRLSQKTSLKKLESTGLSAIAIGLRKPIPGLANIEPDSEKIGKMAAEYFLRKNFTNFAYCGIEDMKGSQDRKIAFKKTIEASGYKTNIYEIPLAKLSNSWDQQQHKMADWLKSLPKPAAIMAYNDDQGRRIITACSTVDIKIPYEVAILGVDNDSLVCDLTTPPLSSINLNIEKAGFEAAKLLDDMISKKTIKNNKIIVNPTHIVTRQSTDILAVSHKQVANAIKFVRENSKKDLQVDDVVDATVLSKRGLQRAFKVCMGHSIHNEITQARLEQLTALITETDLPLSEIAKLLDFRSINRISRFFKNNKGINIRDFRKKYGKI
jgi:LacI family transcriptional regulator